MSQCDWSISFMSPDCGLHSIEDANASQPVLLVSVLGRNECALPEFCSKNGIMVGLCATEAHVQPKYVSALNDVE